ncbi:hypothetical protein JMN32_21010 [Fulvivirga sp. 29W222]|uniref:PsbP C-terminal domain-containing protein n=1 Tax=Fulvivirga marina TaxID=2494733 RepID=A0A937KFY6_9BACT|nr:hypothetical protein [Fulvivirga marina]MBL6448805.1 hypothetical protein [Fulvivirga marina]
MKRVLVCILLLLVLVSYNAQNGGEVISNKCLEISVPQDWQVDVFDESSEEFELVISEKSKQIEKIARMEFYRIEANKNEAMEVAFNRFVSLDFALDTLLEKSSIVAGNLGSGFYYTGEVFFQTNRIQKVFYFSYGKYIVIIHCEYVREDSSEQEEIFEDIISSLVIKC